MANYLMQNWAALLDAAVKIIATIGLWVAYLQYRHSVKIAKENNRRASVELAARQCAHFGKELMTEFVKLRQEIDSSGCQYLKHCKIIKEEQQIKLDASGVTEEDRQKIAKHFSKITEVLNSMEGFAIPFASQVADNEVGFIECGRSFAKLFEDNFGLYCLHNLQHYYKSSQHLYWRWKKQIEQQEHDKRYAEVGKQFFSLSAERLMREKGNSRPAQIAASLLKKIAKKIENKP